MPVTDEKGWHDEDEKEGAAMTPSMLAGAVATPTTSPRGHCPFPEPPQRQVYGGRLTDGRLVTLANAANWPHP